MAPLPDSSSSTLKSYLSSLYKRTLSSANSNINTLAARSPTLVRRASNPAAGKGVTEPNNIPNKFVFVVFGLIGLGFVVTGIWFFFWAKNGGFHFRKNDWEDYKSTVLRRRGPNGTLLSGASESTDLGGGSVVHGQSEKNSRWGRNKKGKKEKRGGGWKKGETTRYKDFDYEDQDQDLESGITGTTRTGTETVITSTESEFSAFKKLRKAGRKGKKDKDRAAMSEVGTVDEDMDASVADAIRSYRHEKPARVGGINKQPDGSNWDGSNTHDGSTVTASSDLLGHREKTPTSTPTKSSKRDKDKERTGGIRKVVSTSQGNGDIGVRARESSRAPRDDQSQSASSNANSERIKAEARKLQEKGRAAQRRDFSFQVGDDYTTTASQSTPSVTSHSRSNSQTRREERAAREARREERERRRASRSPVKKVPGAFYEAVDGGSEVGSGLGERSEVGSTYTGTTATGGSDDTGTKVYSHIIPGLSDYAEERRKRRNGGGGERGGYRRGRGDEEDVD